MSEGSFNASGSKYLREVPCNIQGKVDVYAVLDAFAVVCPARQPAIKKLLCTGIRGKGNALQDLAEARRCDYPCDPDGRTEGIGRGGATMKGIRFRCVFCGCEYDTVEECNAGEESH